MRKRVFLGGSIRIRTLDSAVFERLDTLVSSEYELLVGDADGADLAIQKYLTTRNARSVVVYCTGELPRNNVGQWPIRRVPSRFRPGTREYFTAKDLKMAEDCDYGFLIWDARSTGTLSNIVELLSRGKHSLVYVAPSKDFVKVREVGDLESMVERMESSALSKAQSKIDVWSRINQLRSSSATYSASKPGSEATGPSHLFISYAFEDAALADWLARKLATAGYAVWMDRLKLLGGEPWPNKIDVAIKERTFRMLALLSKHSLKKPNPSKERTLAIRISRSRNIADFLIPLKVDQSELDWLTTDLNYIAFDKGWAHGLKQLLKKLDSINAPKTLATSSQLAARTFEFGADTITNYPEKIFSNAIALTKVPSSLKVYRHTSTLESSTPLSLLDDRWASYQVNDSDVVAFEPPPESLTRASWELVNTFDWNITTTYCDVECANIVRHLIERTLRASLVAARVLVHPERKRMFYLTRNYSKDGKLRFIGRTGKRTWCKIEGKTRILRPGKPAEVVHHLFAFRLHRWHIDEDQIAIQIHPSLVFTDPEGKLITDRRAGSLRRRLTKSWWNNKWLNRLLASSQLIAEALRSEPSAVHLDQQLIMLEAEKSIDESVLTRGPEDSKDEPRQVQIEDDEEIEDEEPA